MAPPNLAKMDNFSTKFFVCVLVALFTFCIYTFTRSRILPSWLDDAQFLGLVNSSHQFPDPIEGEKKGGICCGENMAYGPLANRTKEGDLFAVGKRFDCGHRWLLDRFKLSDNHSVPRVPVSRPGQPGFAFVTAVNDKYFPYAKKLIVSIKQKFGCSQRIIFYDIGGVTRNKDLMRQLDPVCNLEWRTFDFTQLDPDVRYLTSFAWKLFIIAEVLLELDTLMWCDTSVEFGSSNFESFFSRMENDTIGHIIQPSKNPANHGIKYATNRLMFHYLPFFFNSQPDFDPLMMEANFMIIHKSEYTRKLLKWAILCAAEKDCIDPPGSKLMCDTSPEMLKKQAVCNRQDQSILAILSTNAEEQRRKTDPHFLTHFDKRHPLNEQPMKFAIVRRQNMNPNIDFAKTVACC